tara:strand:+ start:6927 stop:7322 length:396 start_codon:yes stop_codon:yes gene_type:complete
VKNKIMKTKVSLSIVGVFNILMALIMAFTVKDLIPTMLNTDLPEAMRMVEIMHYGLFPAILIIGLICLLCKNSSLEVAKKILLSYIIGTTILMFVFFSVFAKEPLMNFGFEMVIPDIIVYIISIVGYFTAK